MFITSGSNAMTFINSIPNLTGQNYGRWHEELEVNLALAEIDLALAEKAPTELPALVRGESETDAAWTARVRDHAPVQAKPSGIIPTVSA